jgi:hypothetical protein
MIAGYGFSLMAWRAACERTGWNELRDVVCPMRMSDGSPCCSVCAEFYRITFQATLRTRIYMETVARTGHRYAALQRL